MRDHSRGFPNAAPDRSGENQVFTTMHDFARLMPKICRNQGRSESRFQRAFESSSPTVVGSELRKSNVPRIQHCTYSC